MNGNPFPSWKQKQQQHINEKIQTQEVKDAIKLGHMFAKEVVKYCHTNSEEPLKCFYFENEWMTFPEFVRRWSFGVWTLSEEW